MSDLEWTRPEAWPLLVLLPVLFAALVWVGCRRRARARAYGVVCADRVPAPWGTAARWTALSGCCVLAWMEPLLGEEELAVEKKGLDVILSVDVSRSMLATDLLPTRLERAKQDAISALDELRPGDRAGLVVFSGVPRLKAPLTHDRGSIRGLIERLSIDDVRIGGTDLSEAVRRSLALVAEGEEASAAVVVLTDGEDLAGDVQAATALAAARGVVLHAVGYGTTEGSKIPSSDEPGGFVVDENGQEVVTTMDADSLRAIARATGGEFLRADTAALPLVELTQKRLLPQVRKVFGDGVEARPKTRYQWVLLPALALLVVEILLGGGWRRRAG